VNTAIFDPLSTVAEQKLTALGTLRGRVGYAFDRVLLYATGGLAYGRTELNTSITDVVGGRWCGPAGLCAAASSSQWQTGWAAGAGLDWAFAPQWSLRGEYLHYDLGSRNQKQFDPQFNPAFPVPVFNSSAAFRGDIVRAAVNFKLN
jgi:outer membrane immunogenic protein